MERQPRSAMLWFLDEDMQKVAKKHAEISKSKNQLTLWQDLRIESALWKLRRACGHCGQVLELVCALWPI